MRIIKILFKKIYLRIWLAKNSKKGNQHLSANYARKIKIPFSEQHCYIRPTISDCARVRENLDSIYHSQNYLNSLVKEKSPILLLDVGANIGLSSLNLVNEFSSIKEILGVEAETYNYEMLRLNYNLFAEQFNRELKFTPIYALASSTSGNFVKEKSSLAEMDGNLSASGTFRYEPSLKIDSTKDNLLHTYSISDLIDSYDSSCGIIIKIDIEGGEEYLFESNTDWLQKVLFLTIEIHDRYNSELLYSSKNFLINIVKHNFAIVPGNDIIHCYNRSLLF